MSIISRALYPLLLERKLVSRLWGGRRIAQWLELPRPYPDTLGETWEVFDSNIIRNGMLAGQTLAHVAESYGAELIGSRPLARYGQGFPLLTKFLDADDRLSLQVHPDDDYAHRREAHTGFHGKTEAWYILSAEPGAEIICGLDRCLDRETCAAAIGAGTLETMVRRVPVAPGDMILVPAGTLHAINAGITLFEIQEKSDLTYRVYDYNRIDKSTGQPRTLHMDKALDVMQMTPLPLAKSEPLPLVQDESRMLLMACSHFALERLIVDQQQQMETRPDSLEIITVLEGRGTLMWPDGLLPLRSGESVVLPASLGKWMLKAHEPPLQVLRGYVPDLEQDIIAPLRLQGISDERIAKVVAYTHNGQSFGHPLTYSPQPVAIPAAPSRRGAAAHRASQEAPVAPERIAMPAQQK